MKDKIIKLIDEKLELPYKEEMKRLIRPMIRIRTSKSSGPLPLGCSKIGGLPDLPKGVEWPYANGDNQHFHFAAQFDFSELSKYDVDGLLPKSGMIYFFVCCDSLGKVIFSAAKKQDLVRLEKAPDTLLPVKKSFMQKLFGKKPEKRIYDECLVEFKIEYSLPSADSFYAGIIEKENDHSPKPCDAFSEEFIESLIELTDTADNTADHQFLGYARGIQHSYKEDEIQNGISTKISDLSINDMKSLLNWILLFQLDSDPNAGMMWGDSGRFYFYIHKEDLVKANFHDVRSAMDCY